MGDLDAVFSHIDSHFERHLEKVQAFVRQPSISGEGVGMEEMAELVAASIRRLGGKCEIVPTSGWPVVYGEINAGQPRTLLIYGMYDVQPVAGEEWIVPPFAGEVIPFEDRGPCVVSRGVYNTKGPLAGTFSALESVNASAGLLRRYLFDPILNIDGIAGGHYGPGSKTLLPHEVRAKMHVRLVPHMEPDEVREKILAHLARVGCADFAVDLEEGYPWAKMSPSAPITQAMIQTIRSFGLEPEVWPNIAGSAPFYLFSRVLDQPFTMGGLGHGGRAHSPNEFATVEGMRLFEKSVVRFLYEFAG